MPISRPAALSLAATLLAVSACATAAPSGHAGHGAAHHGHHAPPAAASLKAADGSARGTASVVRSGDGLELKIAVEGLPAGLHGAHLHTVGRCEAPDFATAGGHLNPHGRMHGSDNPQGKHLGDLPNVAVGADGKGSLTVPLAGPAAELEAQLFDADGTAVVIHAAADDYRTDPTGNSGGRIACGVVSRG